MDIVLFVDIVKTAQQSSHDCRCFFLRVKRLIKVRNLVLLETQLMLPKLDRMIELIEDGGLF